MTTPIYDFVKNYNAANPLRLHMPGHKGARLLGCEAADITEIAGADSLFEANGIIKQSEENASLIFGTSATLYSTEGSSLCIRAMLELVRRYAAKKGQKPLIFAGRNAHKVFTLTAGILDIDVKWLYPDNSTSYLSAIITPQNLENALNDIETVPTAVYITSPDYLGNMSDIKGISEVCEKHGILLLVDNAHGAYLKFLSPSLHPIDLGADVCCDSAHKTLPVLTGGAYLHISQKAPETFKKNAKSAMSIFGSTSPSYLILQSLDIANKHIANGYPSELGKFTKNPETLKAALANHGYTEESSEPLKITVKTKPYGYTGNEFAELLQKQNVFCEFYDPDYVVFMLSPKIKQSELKRLEDILLKIPRKTEITSSLPPFSKPQRVMSIHSALFCDNEEIPVSQARGKILADVNVACPPAVPILVCGEMITDASIALLEYYKTEKVRVVKP